MQCRSNASRNRRAGLSRESVLTRLFCIRRQLRFPVTRTVIADDDLPRLFLLNAVELRLSSAFLHLCRTSSIIDSANLISTQCPSIYYLGLRAGEPSID